ncbi:MAG: class I SAM-dependent methyltransferase [Sphingomicrobium sp.]
MERIVYEQMAELDQQHWWYVARRAVLAALIRRTIRPPNDAAILEVGCGTGHNLAMLGEFGRVDALELDPEARKLAEKRLGKPILSAPLPELDGVPERHYDLVAALDVIEHLADDRAAIESIARRLKPGGKLLMTVPAHQWMWSAHDVANHHQRRYSHRGLRRLFAGSSLRLEKSGFFNSLLFPLAVAERMASKLRGKDDGDIHLPPAWLNTTLEKGFALERYAIGRVPLPPGLSLFAVASAT